GGSWESYLRRAFAPNGDRVTVDASLPHARLVDLRLDPLANVGVGPVAIAGQLGKDRAELTDSLRAFLADEPALDHLHLRAMRHRHRVTFLSIVREGARAGARQRARVLSRRFPGRWCRKRRISRAGCS